MFFETGFLGTAVAEDRAAEGGKCNLGILVRTESAAAVVFAEATEEEQATAAMDGIGTVGGPSSSSSGAVESEVSGESTPSSRSRVSSSRSLAAAAPPVGVCSNAEKPGAKRVCNEDNCAVSRKGQ